MLPVLLSSRLPLHRAFGFAARTYLLTAGLCLAVACGAGADDGKSARKNLQNDDAPESRKDLSKNAFESSTYTTPPYDLAAPTARFGMPLFLKEISGITALDDNTLGAIEDETGSFYKIDMTTGKATWAFTFGPNDDYEDVQRIGDRLFVLRSDATIIELVGWRTGEVELHELFGGFVVRQCDTESLGSDGQQLLVVCKSHTTDGANSAYSIDLATASFGESPLFEVASGKGYLEGGLRPSAIAWHPVLERWIMLSAKREALIVIDTAGRIDEAWDIKPLQLEQPEGIAFLPNGDMWLCTEGKVGTGGIVRLAYQAR